MSGKPRGFQVLSPERRTQIARQGGIAAHKKGTAHRYTSAEARIAGKKGGLASKNRQKLRKIENDAPIPNTFHYVER